MRSLLILTLFFLAVHFVHGQNIATFDFAPIENEIKHAIDNKLVPSIAVAIAKDGKIIYEKAFGYADIANEFKASISTPYQIASVSKPFTATGIMLLQHQQKIRLEMAAEHYISPLKFKSVEGNTADVKVLDLLNHTSGLGTYFQLSYADENVKADDFPTAFAKYGTLFHPSGLISEYSNLGYGLLDYIIEKQSGSSFSQFMNNELFIPLGLKNTFVDRPVNKREQVAQKYDANLQLLPEITNNTKGAGNIYSSIHDLILFGMFHLKNESETELLSEEEIDLMHSYVDEDALYHYYDSTYYGLGWYFKNNDDGKKVIWHEGGMMGASAILKLLPEENMAIAVVINTFNQAYCQEITNQLTKIVLPAYHPSPINETANYVPYTKDTTLLGKWEGFIKIDQENIPCKLHFQADGNIIIDYLDYTYKSYFTDNNPIPNKSILLSGSVNQNSFIGVFPGNLSSEDIRQEFSQFLSLKLYKDGEILSGTIVALAAAQREYYAYPYYIKLVKR